MMKTLLTIASFFLSSHLIGQFKTGTYNLTGDTTALGGNILFSTLTLDLNQDFKFEYRNSSSCFLWYDISGKWFSNQDTVILVDTLIDFERSHLVYNFINVHQNHILITLKTNSGHKLKGAKVSYHFSSDKKPVYFWTNNKGEVEIPIQKFLRSKPLKKEGDDYETTFTIDYRKEKLKISSSHYFKGISNVIDCIVIENPKTDTLLRKTYYRFDNATLTFLKHNLEIESKEHLQTFWGNFKFVGQ